VLLVGACDANILRLACQHGIFADAFRTLVSVASDDTPTTPSRGGEKQHALHSKAGIVRDILREHRLANPRRERLE
jgi:hypothetical protein